MKAPGRRWGGLAYRWSTLFARRGRLGFTAYGVLACGLLVLASPGRADLAQGLGAYAGGSYAKARRELEPLAEAGNAVAQTVMGAMYLSGHGVVRDQARALDWFRRAADQGHIGAQFKLGELYATGEGITQSDVQAERWFERAASNGHPDAQYLLGQRHELSGDAGREAALDWYRKAAAQGHTLARQQLVRLKTGAPRADSVQLPLGTSPAAETGADEAQAKPLALLDSAAEAAQPEASGQAASSAVYHRREFAVQLGAFRRESTARSERDAIRGRHESLFDGLDFRIETADLGVDRGVWHRLRVGPFATLQAAQRLCSEVMHARATVGCFAVPARTP